MAEILGTVAGAAGLVGLSGQILQGCLVVRGFFEDARNAPKDVQQILKELDALEATAKKTKILFDYVNISETLFEKRDFEPALDSCLDIVTKLGKHLKEVSQQFEVKGLSRWWEMMKVSARTKVMNHQLACMERAKSQLHIVQQNIQIALQHKSEDNHRNVTSSLRTIDATNTGIATKIEQVLKQDNEIMSAAKNADRNVTKLSSNLHELQSQITTQNANMATAEMAGHILTQSAATLSTDREILSVSQEIYRTAASTSMGVEYELSQLQEIGSFLGIVPGRRGQGSGTLKSTIKAALFEALAEHSQELINSKGGTSQQIVPDERVPLYNVSDENEKPRRKRSKLISRSRYNFGVFRIDVRTVETSFGVGDANTPTTKPGAHLKTVYRIVPNRFLLGRGLIINHYSSPGIGNFNIQLQAFNGLRSKSSIFEACRTFNIGEVQKLFACRLASPYDRDELGWSPLEVALGAGLKLGTHEGAVAQFKALLLFLIGFDGVSDGDMIPYFVSKLIQREIFFSPDCCSWRTRVVQSLLPVAKVHPLDYDMDRVLSLRASQHPIYHCITQQDFWDVDLDALVPESGTFAENDRHIASDVIGSNLRKAVLQGCTYHVIDDSDNAIWPGLRPTLHKLLALMRNTDRMDVKRGCHNRLVILLANAYDYCEVEFPQYPCYCEFRSPTRDWEQLYDGRLLSPTAFAQNLGLGELWYGILLEAGVSSEEAADIFDTECYIGIPELLDQTRPFLDRDECRALFLENLVTGKFVSFSHVEICREICLMIFNLGLQGKHFGPGYVHRMILEANQSFRQSFMAGSWQDFEGEGFRLVPGVDFSWPGFVIGASYENWLHDEGILWEQVLTGAVKL